MVHLELIYLVRMLIFHSYVAVYQSAQMVILYFP